MKNHMNEDFISKFHALNSQENSEVIIWSSDSSDYETARKENILNMCNRVVNRKRKRANKKLFNSSNLDISFTDSQEKRPERSKQTKCNETAKSSVKYQGNDKNQISASPILLLKHASPSSTVKVKKKLFGTTHGFNIEKSSSDGCEKYIKRCENIRQGTSMSHSQVETKNNIKTGFIINESEKKSNQMLIDKVKSYFDSHFSSESTQHSISEYETGSSISNDVEITSSLTQALPIKLEEKSSSDSLRSFNREVPRSKKVKYKKDGLSHRLNLLLKKQNASFSLWHHEKFLAVNSNFVIPKEEFLVFQIKNICSKYGSFLLEAVDIENVKYLILINSLYVNSNVLEGNEFFKLYKPFRIIDFDINYKFVVNVCKFECTGLGR